MNLASTLPLHARARASHPAIIEGERVVTYGALDARVGRLAGHLRALGLGRDDILAVCLGDHAEHVMLLFAAARLGVPVLPMDWHWSGQERQRVVDFFRPRAALLEAGDAPVSGCATIPRDAAWEAAVAAAAPVLEGPEDPDLPLVLSLSSGTTGVPKGPMITHGNMLARFRGQWVSLGFSQHDRFLVATPLYYGGGRGFAMSYLHIGGTIVMFPPPFRPEALVDEVRRCRVDSMFLVPTQLRRALAIAPADAPLFPEAHRLISSGAALFPEERREIRRRLSPRFMDYYGSTEGGGITVQPAADQDRYPDSVGRPTFMTEVEIAAEDHARQPPGEIGRIRYRGPGVAPGFYKNPEPGTTTGAFFRDGWFYPGDLGVMNEEGYLFLRGRAKDMIIRGGSNVYPIDVELVLQAHPAVEEAAVVGWPSAEYGEEIAAFVIPRAAARGTVDGPILVDHCRERLARYKVPREVFLVDELPRNATGKVTKGALVERLTPIPPRP